MNAREIRLKRAMVLSSQQKRLPPEVVAMQDPNPRVSGGGIAHLEAAGIQVQVGLLETDAKALNPYRRQHSGVDARNGQWEVHYDPYDVSRIWVRNHHEDGWLAATWTHLRSSPVPFGETLWRHARSVADRRGAQKTQEAEAPRMREAKVKVPSPAPPAASSVGSRKRPRQAPPLESGRSG